MCEAGNTNHHAQHTTPTNNNENATGGRHGPDEPGRRRLSNSARRGTTTATTALDHLAPVQVLMNPTSNSDGSSSSRSVDGWQTCSVPSIVTPQHLGTLSTCSTATTSSTGTAGASASPPPPPPPPPIEHQRRTTTTTPMPTTTFTCTPVLVPHPHNLLLVGCLHSTLCAWNLHNVVDSNKSNETTTTIASDRITPVNPKWTLDLLAEPSPTGSSSSPPSTAAATPRGGGDAIVQLQVVEVEDPQHKKDDDHSKKTICIVASCLSGTVYILEPITNNKATAATRRRSRRSSDDGIVEFGEDFNNNDGEEDSDHLHDNVQFVVTHNLNSDQAHSNPPCGLRCLCCDATATTRTRRDKEQKQQQDDNTDNDDNNNNPDDVVIILHLFLGYDHGMVEAHELQLFSPSRRRNDTKNVTNINLAASTTYQSSRRLWQCDCLEEGIHDVALLKSNNDGDKNDDGGTSLYLVIKTRTNLHVLNVNDFPTINHEDDGNNDRVWDIHSLAVLPQAGREVLLSGHHHHLSSHAAPSSSNNTAIAATTTGGAAATTMPLHCSTTITTNNATGGGVATAVGLADGMVALLTFERDPEDDDDHENHVSGWGVSTRRDQVQLPFPSLVGMGALTLAHNGRRYIACCLRGTSTYLIPVEDDVNDAADDSNNTSNSSIWGLSMPHDIDQDASPMMLRLLQGFTCSDWNGIPLLVYVWPAGVIDIYSCGLLSSSPPPSSKFTMDKQEGLLMQELVDNGTAEALRDLLQETASESFLQEKEWMLARNEMRQHYHGNGDFQEVLINGSAFRSVLLELSSRE